MKFLESMLSEETIAELNGKLGEELVKQIDEKLGGFTISAGKEKLIPKTVYDTDKQSLKSQLDDRDKQLKELKETMKDNQTLQDKIAELESVNKNSKLAYEKALTEARQSNALERALAGFRPKNAKALNALLDKSKITYIDDGKDEIKIDGLSEQIDELKKTDGYLFEGYNQGSPNPQIPSQRVESGLNDNALRSAFGLPEIN